MYLFWKRSLFVFLIIVVAGISSFAVHEGWHWVQATKNTMVNAGEFHFGFPQMGWDIEFNDNPTPIQVKEFLKDSKGWEDEAIKVQIISIPLLIIVLFGGLLWYENYF